MLNPVENEEENTQVEQDGQVIKALCIDGGGIRGIIQLILLTELEVNFFITQDILDRSHYLSDSL